MFHVGPELLSLPYLPICTYITLAEKRCSSLRHVAGLLKNVGWMEEDHYHLPVPDPTVSFLAEADMYTVHLPVSNMRT